MESENFSKDWNITHCARIMVEEVDVIARQKRPYIWLYRRNWFNIVNVHPIHGRPQVGGKCPSPYSSLLILSFVVSIILYSIWWLPSVYFLVLFPLFNHKCELASPTLKFLLEKSQVAPHAHGKYGCAGIMKFVNFSLWTSLNHQFIIWLSDSLSMWRQLRFNKLSSCLKN